MIIDLTDCTDIARVHESLEKTLETSIVEVRLSVLQKLLRDSEDLQAIRRDGAPKPSASQEHIVPNGKPQALVEGDPRPCLTEVPEPPANDQAEGEFSCLNEPQTKLADVDQVLRDRELTATMDMESRLRNRIAYAPTLNTAFDPHKLIQLVNAVIADDESVDAKTVMGWLGLANHQSTGLPIRWARYHADEVDRLKAPFEKREYLRLLLEVRIALNKEAKAKA